MGGRGGGCGTKLNPTPEVFELSQTLLTRAYHNRSLIEMNTVRVDLRGVLAAVLAGVCEHVTTITRTLFRQKLRQIVHVAFISKPLQLNQSQFLPKHLDMLLG